MAFHSSRTWWLSTPQRFSLARFRSPYLYQVKMTNSKQGSVSTSSNSKPNCLASKTPHETSDLMVTCCSFVGKISSSSVRAM